MGTENFEALLSSWAQSPTADKLRSTEDGLESGHDFLGEFNIDLLLAPSPPPPPAPGPNKVEDSTGSGTGGAGAQSSAPMSAPPSAASPVGGSAPHLAQQAAAAANGLSQANGLPLALDHQQQQHHSISLNHHLQQPSYSHAQQQHQQAATAAAALGQANHLSRHSLPPYMLPIGTAGSGTLPGLDPAPSHMLAQHSGSMLQLAPDGSAPQHYLPVPNGYPTAPAGPPLVLPTLSAVPASSSQQQGPPSDGLGNGDGKRRRGPRPRIFKKHTCQSDGCTVDLAPLSFYLQRNHICPDHLKAESYLVKGVASRFCQRCGQGHPLTEFEGSKRSCRKALERHNQRRRDKQAASTATGPAAAPAPAPTSEPASLPLPVPLPLPVAEPAELAQQAQQAVAQAQAQAHADAMMGAWLDDTFAAMQGLQQQQQQPQQQQVARPPPQQQQPQRQVQMPQPALNYQQQQQALQAPQPQAQAPQQASQQQQQAQQAQQAQQVGMSSPPSAAYQQQQQQQVAAPSHVPLPVQQLLSQPWVMLPRQLIEQHAPHLISAAIPAASPPPAWQVQQTLQAQLAAQPPAAPLPPPIRPPQPQPQLMSMSVLEEASINLWQGEFGGSGI